MLNTISYAWRKLWRFFAYVLIMALLLWTRSVDPSDVSSRDTLIPSFIATFLAEKRLTIGVILAAIATVLPRPQDVITPNRYAKNVRKGILEGINEDIFERQNAYKRITLFTECAPIRNFLLHFVMYSKWVWKKSWKDAPEWGQFLVIRDRVGEDRRAKWGTAFYCHYSKIEECQGIAARALRAGEVISEDDLPDLRDIDLSSIRQTDITDPRDELENSDEVAEVRNYMDRCGINDIQSLRQISAPARHIWASPIRNRVGKKIGVLVIDSREESSFLADDLTEQLEPYVASLSPTYLEGHYA